mgnify:CR=1 FL=1
MMLRRMLLGNMDPNGKLVSHDYADIIVYSLLPSQGSIHRFMNSGKDSTTLPLDLRV